MKSREYRSAFTLIELLVVIAIIGLLISILIPSLSAARTRSKSTVCLTRLRTMGQGMLLYANANRDTMVPGRLPKLDDDNWRMKVVGGVKYRPSFLVMMESQVGIPPFNEPKASKTEVDSEGQPGDRQNYASEQYVCPEVDHWVDERNGAYGYNYQFLGNSRLLDSNLATSYKNWPVMLSWVRSPSQCVAVGDSLGTAAAFPPRERGPYEDNAFGDSRSGRSLESVGNEGFNLDPPRVDPKNGEMADLDGRIPARSAVHIRHGDKGNVLWVDGHASSETLESLGYTLNDDGVINFDGDNRYFHINREDQAWVKP